jgi:Raf kinase inhibitor-like YbhB/YbcL family protein
MKNIIIKYKYIFIILGIIIVSIIYINSKGDIKMNNTSKDNVKEEVKFYVTSPAFKNGDYIPSKYTGHGEDISIPLEFNNIILTGKSIAIIMDDPDAPTAVPFVHWLIWNIPTSITKILENIPDDSEIASLGGAIQGENDFGNIGYGGPNPPSGTHTYRIKVYVLDCLIDLKRGSSKESLENAMKGHILQSDLLEGKFSH